MLGGVVILFIYIIVSVLLLLLILLLIFLFLTFVSPPPQDGNTCAHIAAKQGSVDVVRELMRHNRGVVINGKNRVGESTPLHLAAEGGHSNLVKFLIENGASPKAENGVMCSCVYDAELR